MLKAESLTVDEVNLYGVFHVNSNNGCTNNYASSLGYKLFDNGTDGGIGGSNSVFYYSYF